MNDDFESMIERYSSELLLRHKQWQDEGIIKADEAPLASSQQKTHEEPQITVQDTENVIDDTETMPQIPILTDTAPTDTAVFYARVFTGDGAYPLKGAKVVLRRDGQLISFTVTDKNGETPRVKIPAYQKQNTLEPFGENQRFDYFADVYMNGFTTKKDLLVSAVGGSDAVLDVQMTPIAERVD